MVKTEEIIAAMILIFVSFVAFGMGLMNLANPYIWIVFVLALIFLVGGIVALADAMRNKK